MEKEKKDSKQERGPFSQSVVHWERCCLPFAEQITVITQSTIVSATCRTWTKTNTHSFFRSRVTLEIWSSVVYSINRESYLSRIHITEYMVFMKENIFGNKMTIILVLGKSPILLGSGKGNVIIPYRYIIND